MWRNGLVPPGWTESDSMEMGHFCGQIKSLPFRKYGNYMLLIEGDKYRNKLIEL